MKLRVVEKPWMACPFWLETLNEGLWQTVGSYIHQHEASEAMHAFGAGAKVLEEIDTSPPTPMVRRTFQGVGHAYDSADRADGSTIWASDVGPSKPIAAEEVEVTPAMIMAGIEQFSGYSLDPGATLTRVYQAMHAALSKERFGSQSPLLAVTEKYCTAVEELTCGRPQLP